MKTKKKRQAKHKRHTIAKANCNRIMIKIVNHYADIEFEKEVKTELKKIKMSNYPNDLKKILKTIRKNPKNIDLLNSLDSSGLAPFDKHIHMVTQSTGDYAGTFMLEIIDQIYSMVNSKFFPHHSIIGSFDEAGRVVLTLESLHKYKNHGYYSKSSPLININGEMKKIVLSEHAINRWITRQNLNMSKNQTSKQLLFFLNTSRFEYNTINTDDKTHALKFYAKSVISIPINTGISLNWEKIPHIYLGVNNACDMYIVCKTWGYVPVCIENEYLIAKTILKAGMKGTPEETFANKDGHIPPNNIIKYHDELKMFHSVKHDDYYTGQVDYWCPIV